jgi:glycosyltransferase involved in cell wall biosynthesis
VDRISVGIDASNVRVGGGITHLGQLLHNARPRERGVERVVVWSGRRTLDQLPSRNWLEKVHVPFLDGPLPVRALWQQFLLPGCLRRSGCDVLFSPGATLPWRISLPSVVMSQTLLPFERKEAARFGFRFARLKMALLRRMQSRSMKRADGLIFLTRYARDTVLSAIGCSKDTTIIPHGVEERFFCRPRPAMPLSKFSFESPFKILYVSTVDVYKHQWQVVKAVDLLRQRGLPVEVDLIGPAYPPALRRLRKVIEEVDPAGLFAHYKGPVTFRELHASYHHADGFVFASSCENLPNILLEAMAAGLPIACSNIGPMPEVLGEAGFYFDPEQPADIARAVQELIEQDELRLELAHKAYTLARGYSWKRCAAETFLYLAECARARGAGRAVKTR